MKATRVGVLMGGSSAEREVSLRSGEAVARIEDSPLECVIVADTIPIKTKSPKIRVKSVAKVFAEAIKRTHEDKSISSLFDVDKG